MMTDTVCAESPVSRAISAFDSAPSRRRIERTKRSLWARTPVWFVPRMIADVGSVDPDSFASLFIQSISCVRTLIINYLLKYE